MSVTKNPAIAALDPDSLCHSIYTELYNQFFNAQEKKSISNPYGVEEGDDTSIRLHNTAYGFAYAIAGAVEGGGSGGNEGGILLDYLRKDGGDMSGWLRSNYGFEAGIDNKTLLSAFNNDDSAGILFPEDIDIRGSIYMLGHKVLGYDSSSEKLTVTAAQVDLGQSRICIQGEMIFGTDKETGIYITPSMFMVGGKSVYHQGNANLDSVDWTMRNATIAGNMQVAGEVSVTGKLTALYGAGIGNYGRTMMNFGDGEINVSADLSFAPDCGIKIDSYPVLGRVGTSDIGLGGMGGDLLLGGTGTDKIKLLSGLMDADGDYMLISPYGAALFPDSLTVRHNYGDTLLSSYRVDSDDEGIVIHKRLRLGTEKGPFLYTENKGVGFNSVVEYIDSSNGSISRFYHNTLLSYGASTSLQTPANTISNSLLVDTDADFIVFNKPLEGKNYIGIDHSHTRLTDGCLFFSESLFLLRSTDGIKHYGNAYMLGDLGSELFSSGFAGSGWAIQKNATTGNVTATFDEFTIRKRMRVYELEVQRMSATNGSLWISDSFSGYTVEQVQ